MSLILISNVYFLPPTFVFFMAKKYTYTVGNENDTQAHYTPTKKDLEIADKIDAYIRAKMALEDALNLNWEKGVKKHGNRN